MKTHARPIRWLSGLFIVLAVHSFATALRGQTCVPPPAGLVSWWRAEGDANDELGGAHGTLVGNATYGTGQVGAGFVFDGYQDAVNLGNPVSLQLQAFTIEAWVKRGSTNQVTRDSITSNGVILAYGEGGYGFIVLNDGRLALTKVGFSNVASSVLRIAGTNLHHVAVTKSRSTVVFYLDGVAETAAPYDPTFTFGTSVLVGARGDNLSASFWGGIDEAAVYGRALAAAEVEAIYLADSAGKCFAPPPSIATQPTNLTVYVGSNATFRVFATGARPFTHQWRLRGTNLPGGTESVLMLTNVQFSSAGPYSAVVTNAFGVATSSVALLTVNPLPECVPPPAGLVSWWRAEIDAKDNWGSNNGNFHLRDFLTAGKVGQAFYYPLVSVPDALSLRVTNGLTLEAWVNPSSVAGLTPRVILSKFDYPVFTPVRTQSAYLLGLTNNGALFFTVSATGDPQTNTTLVTTQTLAAGQWSLVVATYDGAALRIYLNGALAAQTNYSGGIFPGAANLFLGAVQDPASSFPSYYWQFPGLLDEVSLYNRALTDAEILAIYNADAAGKCLVPPTIVTQPQDQAIPLGEDGKFSVAIFGSRPLRYQWRFNGTNLAGATNSALVLEKLQTNRLGNYSVFVSNAVGTATSSNAALTLLPPPTCTDTPAGLISWWPGDGNLADATGVNPIGTFSPTSYVTGKVDRAFSFNGTSSRLSFSSPFYGQGGLDFRGNTDFTIEMWIKAGASNTVYPNVPLFERRTVVGNRWIGYSLSLNLGRLAFAMGSLPSSATNVSSFISSGPDLRDAMFHHVAVTVNRTNPNGGHLYVDGQDVQTFDPTPRKDISPMEGYALSIGAPVVTTTNSYFGGLIDEPAVYKRALTAEEILAIAQAGAAGKCKVMPSILVQPVNQRVTVGSNATFNVTAAGTPALRFQWFRLHRPGGPVPAATSSIYMITNVSALDSDQYFCRVTNIFGSVFSSNAVLTVNNVPTALPQTGSLNEDTPTPITLLGSDPDHDPLSYPIVTPPAHGALSGTGSNVVYTPSPNYNGPDSFTFKVNDGLVDSAPATVSLTILPVNDPPVAPSQSIALDEDTTAAITLGAFDVDGDPLTFTVGAPAHGALTGTPPNLSYRPSTNYFGPDSFTFRVSDGQTNSELATVSLTVRLVNDSPVAKIVVSPLVELPGITNRVVIARVCGDAEVVLDGSGSSDVENDPLTYSWIEGTNAFAQGATVTNEFAPGTHELALLVSDGAATTRETVTVEVVAPSEAVAALILFIAEAHLDRPDLKPLVRPLQEAMKDMDHCKAKSAVKDLREFQKELKKIEKRHPALAAQLLAAAQTILDAVDDEKKTRHHEPPQVVTTQ